ncbi:histone H1-III-1, putative [Pediculus humanus corporis]|uniref:Histone H1-III-1, putative n=1 Tax=Pediculus humanus subsp. corporis TaxID=121224 RepID=E0VKE9_PEDHC|nr:histone H1-III-1, putative [Pediculus humanus corporis]EEB13865.1 histone H1-III-1, putative [Pediculus humanus corporis]
MEKERKFSMSDITDVNVSLRPSELVITAISNLRGEVGSSAKEITNFISEKYDIEKEKVTEPVCRALERGVRFGVLSEGKKGFYQLYDFNNGLKDRNNQQKNNEVSTSTCNNIINNNNTGNKKFDFAEVRKYGRGKRVTIKQPPSSCKKNNKNGENGKNKRKGNAGRNESKLLRGRKRTKQNKLKQIKKIQQQKRKKSKNIT